MKMIQDIACLVEGFNISRAGSTTPRLVGIAQGWRFGINMAEKKIRLPFRRRRTSTLWQCSVRATRDSQPRL